MFDVDGITLRLLRSFLWKIEKRMSLWGKKVESKHDSNSGHRRHEAAHTSTCYTRKHPCSTGGTHQGHRLFLSFTTQRAKRPWKQVIQGTTVTSAGNNGNQCQEPQGSGQGTTVTSAGNHADRMSGATGISAGNQSDQCQEPQGIVQGTTATNARNHRGQCRELW